MSRETNRPRGRPRVADEGASITLRIDASKLELADAIAHDLDVMLEGMRHTRGDVLRAALSRGLDAMRADVDAKMKTSTRSKREG